MERLHSLRILTSALILSAILIGASVVWLWMQSNADWRRHQDTAFHAGVTLYAGLQNGTSYYNGVRVTALSPADQDHARVSDFQHISNTPQAARITNVPILADAANPLTSAPLALVILSPDLVYGLAGIPYRNGQTAAETTGEVFRILASFCSDPVVLAQYGDAPWVRIDGAPVWGCAAAPADNRLWAVLIAAIGLACLMTVSLNLSSDFTSFADQLRNRRRVGGPDKYTISGPSELQDIVAAVNGYLETERAQLEGRAAVLSGVSHDLGTPATRLRLRAALIEDQNLRRKLESDIDSMTGMIDSVLTYTRAEMNTESPRKLSLNALIDAIIANYTDMGQAVTFRQAKDVVVQGGSSVFMSRTGQTIVTGERQITVVGRPIALERALTNLIDNALKYGRRATVTLETDARSATIIVEDEGTDNSAKDIEALMAPYKRGKNTATIEGYGLGLTIVATIAALHGGSLTFEDSAVGVCARLAIQRQ
ncbi:MAG: signal transduction histidine kinase [Celeribacter sp.]|jgi:two-component system osmolarity sensor histidine kinase EnvZ